MLHIHSIRLSFTFLFLVFLSSCGGGESAGPTVPDAAPDAPVIGTATAGNTQASVTFTAPTSDGGAAISGYTVSSSPGGLTTVGASSPLVVTGLINGVAYTFTVTASNSVGTGAASAASNSVSPAGVPDAPTIGTATAGNVQASVTFTAPASDGGAAISVYTVISSPGGLTTVGASSPLVVTGLTNGVAYTFTVTASNSVGTGAASAASNSVTPVNVPDAPTIATAIAGDTQASVAFNAPISDGGAAISGYTVSSNPGGLTVAGVSSPLIVTGLTNGVAYTFTVTASNSVGTSAASVASNSVTPLSVTAPTVSVSATSPKLLTFSWTGIVGATHYKLLKNLNGTSGYTQLGVDLPDTATTATDYIGVHLHDWINTRYIVQACDVDGCTDSSAVFTTAAMIDAIGYIKTANNGPGDRFGISVALSGDGATLAVGAYLEDSSTIGINSTPNNSATSAGAVYVFRRSGTVWSEQAYIKASNTGGGDQFGEFLALSNDGAILAVGAFLEDSSTTGINSAPDELALRSGAVYVYSRSGTVWSEQAYIKASNTGAEDRFGYSVALSGDGATLAVGAYFEDSSTTGSNSTPDEASSHSGAVYVYSRSGTVWSEQAYLKASNTGMGDQFGYTVTLSSDGANLAVGAIFEDSGTTGSNSTPDEAALQSGAVYVFSRNGTVWSEQAYLKASNSGADDWFGGSLALSNDGITLAVGAYFESSSTTGINSMPDEAALRSGAVYVFSRSGTLWSEQAYIKASNTGTGDRFGYSIALTGDGATLVVGAFLENSSTTGINSTPDEAAIDAGAVYIYSRSGTAWSEQVYLKASNSGSNDHFGIVALSDDGVTLAVGAEGEDSSTTSINSTPNENAGDAGAVYLY